ncbi:MAG: hypothetical protein COV55_03965 [Candidatus Komeilibacteria bacterium CG11_big_fil_rev_8_21_14_0_20_36_20]|uniref:O-antigen ligase-related domain-containing protein n=1 Tax=Candidatus Komeilibacteria bacterium CG11_big_fil_rev_8_21_14_0_20_36_20 TaxID=1974477 RepID=A0A2H0NBZ8_9BACT|nr:MAG: hypothetical protein COV55_03965 [Candidatus Komeilibacteria bacterium CG11_big_fil_rev_8_21_14_0_20_36_20]PIR81987.1 MAG: hypothetical protein COU21_00600 [Candidatus Komeilibacteria bacterium CG10_big_fil_rev_8_21_14_0_10_36_65]PJC55525.1 MAG: hypothetical protein CO027_01605 [Candidatus Komeilibacteria bacterium CG_4_9_14_0_2_um_filter_36_13]
MSYFSKNKRNDSWRIWLAIFIIAELLSWLAFNFSQLNLLILSLVGLSTIVLSLKNPIYTLFLPLAELFWGSLGHSFYYGVLNTRLVVFISVIFVFVIQLFLGRRQLKIKTNKSLWFIWLLILLLVVGGIVLAYYERYAPIDIFLDANAYLYLLYLPVWYQFYDAKYLTEVVDILKAAALVIALKTLVMFNIFAQEYSWLDMNSIYKWIRDTRTGEITFFYGNFWRIFMQSQVYLIAAWFIIFIKQLREYQNGGNFIYLSILTTALYISLSRSFWLGLVVGLIFLLVHLIIYQKKQIFFLSGLLLGSLVLSSFILLQLFLNVPQWKRLASLSQRGIDTAEPAANSRLQLLAPLWQAIKEQPIVGYGFGKKLTYYSVDPRIKNEQNPEGLHTTYAFEWGWLDQWLKSGIFFIVLMWSWIILIYNRGYRVLAGRPEILLPILATLTSLVVIHIFTPFLNHPLGLGLLMLITIISFSYGQESKSYR